MKESRKFELARLKKIEGEEEERKTFWPSGDFLVSQCFLAPLGVFFVMKTLEDER